MHQKILKGQTMKKIIQKPKELLQINITIIIGSEFTAAILFQLKVTISVMQMINYRNAITIMKNT